MKNREMAKLTGTVQVDGITCVHISTAATDFPAGREVWVDTYVKDKLKSSISMSSDSASVMSALFSKSAAEI